MGLSATEPAHSPCLRALYTPKLRQAWEQGSMGSPTTLPPWGKQLAGRAGCWSTPRQVGGLGDTLTSSVNGENSNNVVTMCASHDLSSDTTPCGQQCFLHCFRNKETEAQGVSAWPRSPNKAVPGLSGSWVHRQVGEQISTPSTTSPSQPAAHPPGSDDYLGTWAVLWRPASAFPPVPGPSFLPPLPPSTSPSLEHEPLLPSAGAAPAPSCFTPSEWGLAVLSHQPLHHLI